MALRLHHGRDLLQLSELLRHDRREVNEDIFTEGSTMNPIPSSHRTILQFPFLTFVYSRSGPAALGCSSYKAPEGRFGALFGSVGMSSSIRQCWQDCCACDKFAGLGPERSATVAPWARVNHMAWRFLYSQRDWCPKSTMAWLVPELSFSATS